MTPGTLISVTTLSGNTEALTNLFKSSCSAIGNTKTKDKYLLLTLGKSIQYIAQLFLQ